MSRVDHKPREGFQLPSQEQITWRHVIHPGAGVGVGGGGGDRCTG